MEMEKVGGGSRTRSFSSTRVAVAVPWSITLYFFPSCSRKKLNLNQDLQGGTKREWTDGKGQSDKHMGFYLRGE